jgi:predicted transcriptional regulator
LTQQGLANEAGVNRSLLAKVERGHANPSYGEAKKIFETLERLEAGVPLRLVGITLDRVHNTEIMYAEADEPLYLVEKRMSDKAYSQLPVRKNGRIVGSLTERGMNRALMASKGIDPKALLVEDAMEDGFPVVPASVVVGAVATLLQACQAVLTNRGGEVVGIVTNADLLKLFSLYKYP